LKNHITVLLLLHKGNTHTEAFTQKVKGFYVFKLKASSFRSTGNKIFKLSTRRAWCIRGPYLTKDGKHPAVL